MNERENQNPEAGLSNPTTEPAWERWVGGDEASDNKF